ncbi:TRAP transporter small permease [Ketogulonicigenium vulgare]|uniref:TRAP transporter small permease n=1 Tax=Ketogulonicigenium vulgare TaxID=92945 RepID=UPI0023590439|nr:TRAP transporter small permease subunit [Ketogulonicigenium vulgare]
MKTAAKTDPKWLHIISRFSHGLNLIAATFAAVLVTVMLLTIVLEVVLRLFSRSTYMADAIVANGLSIATFMTLAWAMESGSMIRVNIVQQMVNDRIRYVMELICTAAAAALTGWLWYYIYLIFERSFQRGSLATYMISFPKWYLDIFPVIGIALLFIHICVRLLRLIFVGDTTERALEI